ncbi:transglutaminase domain-containing protein [uncultured Flavobacterium sp.]|uniref:transglutaminase domain-containing protein n=1 Tax=uncultured Flavobacterium sp. TaxID=165435 RepID=UPI0025ECE05F|nr:transglutaminase domain-containing protein [uncultured Flavobacterium sp.]
MIKRENIDFKKIKAKLQVKKPWDNVIIFVLNILIAIPVFIIIHQNLIDPEWPFQIDRILLFVSIVVLIQLILRLLRTIIIICLALYLVALIYGSTFGNYGFNSVFEDYRSMVYSMSDDPNPQDIIISKLLPFPNKSKILSAIEYDNPEVRNFALLATTKYFRNVKGYKGYRRLIQTFAVFKEIQKRWNYVNDPKGKEYIARATESLIHFSGDCDDHAILMAACVRAVGSTPRLIHTGGHIYPEVLIGNKVDLEAVNYLIKEVLFKEESKGKELHYHIDERGQIWLNLDYTATYPGGPFMSEEILGALTLN